MAKEQLPGQNPHGAHVPADGGAADPQLDHTDIEPRSSQSGVTVQASAADLHAGAPADQQAEASFVSRVIKTLFSPSLATIGGAIIAALLISVVIVAAFDEKVRETAGYLFARPSDFFAAVGEVVFSFFESLLRGAIWDYQATDLLGALHPLTESLTAAAPLIIAGLSVAVGFRAGLFNIGAQGQLIIGATVAGYVGFTFNLPWGLHLVVAILAAIIGGALWGAIPGVLKAKTGAHEVIVTIMLNTIAASLLGYLLQTTAFIGDGISGKSQAVAETARYPQLLGSGFAIHGGIIVAVLAALGVWWMIERSTFGFELRAAGANPSAAKTAGISVNKVIVWTLVIAGALAGLAGTMPVLGTEGVLTGGTAASYGFDAITVALLGQSSPIGIIFAGLLFGALNAAAAAMQGVGIPADIVQITQAVIVLLIAASEAVKYYRTKRAIAEKTKQRAQKGEEK